MDGGYGIFFDMRVVLKMRGVLLPLPTTLCDLQIFSLII